MLVLSRQRDESIVLDFSELTSQDFEKLKAGEPIEICVCDFRFGFKVRLGVSAPKSVAVHRFEVWEAIKREQKQLQEPDKPAVEPS